jgi:hypothetical protein
MRYKLKLLYQACFLLSFLCCLLPSLAQALSLRADAPKEYIVKRGDTLWEIASRYLKNPWEWKELWRANPNIKNPNHLYAGAVIVLDTYRKKPYLRVLSNGTIKLSPNIRATEAEEKIPAIPLGDIKPFLTESLILDEDILYKAPYVVALSREHMLGGQGDEIFVKGLHSSPIIPEGETIEYSLFRPGKTYVDPATKKLLGYKATLVGFGELTAGGEPATVLLTEITAGVKKEDKVLINNSPEFELYFEPSAPATTVNGLIIEMLASGMPAGTSQGAVGNIVVLNLGAQAGLKAGDVLGVYAKPRIVTDPQNHLISIKLPPERVGEALVFRPFTKTSFALIVRSSHAIYLLDTVSNP